MPRRYDIVLEDIRETIDLAEGVYLETPAAARAEGDQADSCVAQVDQAVHPAAS
jgi:hypothetical protein